MSSYQNYYVGTTAPPWLIPLTAGGVADDLTNVDISKFTMIFQPTNPLGGVDRTGTGTFSIKSYYPGQVYYKPSVADVASAFNGNLVVQSYIPPSNTTSDEVVYDPISFVITPR